MADGNENEEMVEEEVADLEGANASIFDDGALFRAFASMDFGLIAAALTDSQHDSTTITPLVLGREYQQLQKALKSEVKNVNCFLDVPNVQMTGLEHSIYTGDRKMASIFFAKGADPMENKFDGVIHNHASYNGVGDPEIVQGFDGSSTIPGFPGLRALLSQEDEFYDELVGYLSLVELCLSNELQSELTTDDFEGHLGMLQNVCGEEHEDDYIQVKEKMVLVPKICQQGNLDEESTTKVSKQLFLTLIWGVLVDDVINGLQV